MLNMRVLGGYGVVPGIALPPTHPAPTTPGTPPLPQLTVWRYTGPAAREKHAVGLKSVAQLT